MDDEAPPTPPAKQDGWAKDGRFIAEDGEWRIVNRGTGKPLDVTPWTERDEAAWLAKQDAKAARAKKSPITPPAAPEADNMPKGLAKRP